MRDYAKRSSYSPPRKNNDSQGGWILILMGIATICFFSYVIYHFKQEKESPVAVVTEKPILASSTPQKIATEEKTIKIPQKEIKKHPPKKTVAAKQEKNLALNATDNEPKYDFYQLLPEMKVNVPVPDETQPVLNAVLSHPKTEHYVLQIASLQTQAEALQVQKAISTMQYKTFIQSYQAPDHTTWYHVMVGPFNDLAAAQKEQNDLDAHQIEAMLIKS